MSLPLVLAIKNFFGIFALTPFEHALLERLSEALDLHGRTILAEQISRFTTVRRLLKHIDEPMSYGFTNFHTVRFGKNITDICQTRRFEYIGPETLLATANVRFKGGEMEVQFWLVKGVLFCLEYRSPQKNLLPQW